MTWKEFKEAVEAKGVKDDDVVFWIDVCNDAANIDVARDRNSDGATVTIGVAF